MQKMFKKGLKNGFAAVVALAFVLSGASPALAQTANATSSLATQIQALLQQVKSLQEQIEAVNKQKAALVSELRQTILLTRQLREGMTDEEVKTLQEILSTDSDIYPEGLVTGFFGPLTRRAVERFQEKYGIESIGEVGPKTRAAIHRYLGGLNTATSTAGVFIPPGLAKKLGMSTGYATGTPSDYSNAGAPIIICHYPPGNPAAKHTITIGAAAWQAHQSHGDTFGPCVGQNDDDDEGDDEDEDEDEDGDDDDADTTAPTISNIAVSGVSSTTATVSWSTNEEATGILWYSTSTPLATSTAGKLENSTLQTSQNFGLSSLAATTTYYYLISAKDSSGNTATSSERYFVTAE